MEPIFDDKRRNFVSKNMIDSAVDSEIGVIVLMQDCEQTPRLRSGETPSSLQAVNNAASIMKGINSMSRQIVQ